LTELHCFIRIADLIPSRYGVFFEVDDYPARQPSDLVTFFLLDHQSVPQASPIYGYDLRDGIIGECMFTHIFMCYIQIIFHASGKTSVPLARHRYDADALGGDEASVDRSDDGNVSAGTEGSGRPPKVDNMLHDGLTP
jgi:hypothetical protein